MRVVSLLVALSAVTVSGCIKEAADWQASGAFTAEPRPDWDEWEALVAKYSDEPAVIMESFPEQFRVVGMFQGECNAFVREARDLPYVERVGPCVET